MNFPGIIRIDLSKLGEVRYDVSGADRLWMAKFVLFGGAIVENAVAGANSPILGIRIQEQSNDQMPWSLQDGYMNSFSGKFTRLWVTVLANPSSLPQMFLNTGNGVAAAYCNPDGLSPVVGAGTGTYVGPVT
jgi:hypothetical protein